MLLGPHIHKFFSLCIKGAFYICQSGIFTAQFVPHLRVGNLQLTSDSHFSNNTCLFCSSGSVWHFFGGGGTPKLLLNGACFLDILMNGELPKGVSYYALQSDVQYHLSQNLRYADAHYSIETSTYFLVLMVHTTYAPLMCTPECNLPVYIAYMLQLQTNVNFPCLCVHSCPLGPLYYILTSCIAIPPSFYHTFTEELRRNSIVTRIPCHCQTAPGLYRRTDHLVFECLSGQPCSHIMLSLSSTGHEILHESLLPILFFPIPLQ